MELQAKPEGPGYISALVEGVSCLQPFTRPHHVCLQPFTRPHHVCLQPLHALITYAYSALVEGASLSFAAFRITAHPSPSS